MATKSLSSEVLGQSVAMTSHAFRSGKAVPGWVLETISSADPSAQKADRSLYRAHGELCRLVAPTKPDLLVALDGEASPSKLRQAMGPLDIARTFIVVAILSLLLFLGLSLSPYLRDAKASSIFTSSGMPLLHNELFFLAAAAVGASFSNLFDINREIAAGTFSSSTRATYWVRFILGIVGGLLLATVLNLNTLAPASGDATRMHFQSATLALMGGFSSSVVQKIVQRLIEALESLLKSSVDQELRAREAQHQQELDAMTATERMRTSLMLADIRRRLASGEDPKALSEVVSQASKDALAGELTESAPAA